jgi:hypothetical protein
MFALTLLVVGFSRIRIAIAYGFSACTASPLSLFDSWDISTHALLYYWT